MFHSLIQQVMQQDPVYWILYVTLQSDHNYHLISYLYYTKYAKSDDSIFFWHIDLNLTDLITNNCGSNQIQGMVLLDDEQKDQCTQILSDIH